MTRILTLTAAATLLALPTAALACPAHEAHTAATEVTSTDLAAAKKKVSTDASVKDEKTDATTPAAPAK